MQARWPAIELGGAHQVLVDEDDELVVDGIDSRTGARVVVSMRDLGDDVSAGFWDEEIARLVMVRHPSAARVLKATIVDDRFFVVTTKVPAEAMPLKLRLDAGPLDGATAALIAMAALDVAVELHALGLSAAGTRVRSMMEVIGGDGTPALIVTTFGLHVDNDVEVFNDVREIALRVLGWAGGQHARGALVIPERLVAPEVAALFRRAVGVELPHFASAREMLDELANLTGQKKRRGNERVQVSTRPIAQAATMFGSELLLAEEFLTSHDLDDPEL